MACVSCKPEQRRESKWHHTRSLLFAAAAGAMLVLYGVLLVLHIRIRPVQVVSLFVTVRSTPTQQSATGLPTLSMSVQPLRGESQHASVRTISPMRPRSVTPLAITPQTFARNPDARQAHVYKCAGVEFDMFVHNPKACRYMSRYLMNGGWECHVIDQAATEMARHPGESFMDVGSNVGAFSLTFAHLGYRVFAFEPMMYNAELQAASMGSFPMKGELNLFNTAVAATTGGELCIHAENHDAFNSGNGQISPGPCTAGDETVPSFAIGDIMKQYPGVCVAVLKIDIEGYEGHALRGAEYMFTGECPPCTVFLEYNKKFTVRSGVRVLEVFGFFKKHGYQCKFISGDDWRCDNESSQHQKRCKADGRTKD